MKILAIHSDYLKFQAKKKAIKAAEDYDKDLHEMKECLVVFVASETKDETNPTGTATELVEQAKKIAEQVQTTKIVLYPYAHLSSDLSKPDTALKIMSEAEEMLKKEKFEVMRAPFGWYKSFEISCKGHPLSELSREFGPEEEKLKTREEVVEDIDRRHIILTQDGEEYELNIEDEKSVVEILDKVNDESLKKYVLSEEIKGQSQKEPPSIKMMQQMELVGYAPECDPGNFKFYPKGNMMFELLKDWADKIAIEKLNSIQIDTPILYDWADKEIREQGGSFHERHYTVNCPDEPRKELVLRFAGDFGLFKIMKKANISYKNLPVRVYEFSKSFRYEKRGELSGLRRLRAFHMPDIHCFCGDLGEGWDEYQELYRKYDDLLKGTGVEFAIVFRIVEDFYKKHKDKILEMLKYSKHPAFIETLSGMKHYWAVKHEFQGIDSVGGNCQLSTVQLDVKDAETYGIVYTDKDGQKKGCTICHSSIGSIERIMFSILEDAMKKEIHSFPLWLSPTQVRIIPVSTDKHLDFCKELQEKLAKENIRVDIDDHNKTMGKKIRDAEEEWTPYILVVGDKEIEEKELMVRNREAGKQEKMKTEDLIEDIKKKIKGMPYKPLPLPTLLSKRPIFVG